MSTAKAAGELRQRFRPHDVHRRQRQERAVRRLHPTQLRRKKALSGHHVSPQGEGRRSRSCGNRALKDIPVWAFNGATDAEIPPENTRKTIALLKELGAHPKYTEYPGVGHTPEYAYREKELYAWLRKQSKNPAVGDWHLNQRSVGPSKLHITATAGKLEVQEVGNGNARSTIATCKDGLLVIHWEVSENLRGYWVLNMNREHTKGSGRTVFIRFKDFERGEPREIEGRKVRVVEGVTIDQRIACQRLLMTQPHLSPGHSNRRSHVSRDLLCATSNRRHPVE